MKNLRSKKTKFATLVLSASLVVSSCAFSLPVGIYAATYTEQEVSATTTYPDTTPIAAATLQETNGVYSVASASDWAKLCELCTAENNYLAGKTVVLTANLDLSAAASLIAFSGKLDGNGKTVSGTKAPLVLTLNNGAEVCNLVIDGAVIDSASGASGAVAEIAAASSEIRISNVEVKNADISSSTATALGGFVGLHSDVGVLKLTNCKMSGSIDGKDASIKVVANDPAVAEFHIGGFVGRVCNAGGSNLQSGSLELYNCKNSADVTIHAGKNVYMGGMLGDGYAVKAEGCLNTGSVADSMAKNHVRAGGIVGRSTGGTISFIDCENTGLISSCVPVGQNRLGGMAGQLENVTSIEVTGCINRGEVKRSGAYSANCSAGGMIGQSNFGGEMKIADCVNYGFITTDGETGGMVGIVSNANCKMTFTNCKNEADLVGEKDCGGMVGLEWGTILVTGCVNNGMITCVDKTPSDSTNTGEGAGGIVGMAQGMITMENCLNTGDVFNTIHGAGGILGYARVWLSIKNCTNFGDVYCAVAKGETKVPAQKSGNQRAGGIVGWVYLDNANTPLDEIVDCMNFGKAIAPNASGGMIGQIQNTKKAFNIENCFSSGDMTVGYNAGTICGRAANNNVTIKNCIGTGTLDYQYTSGTNKGVIVGCKNGVTVVYTGCKGYAVIDGQAWTFLDGTETPNVADMDATKFAMTAFGIAGLTVQKSAAKEDGTYAALFVAGIENLDLSATGFEVTRLEQGGNLSNTLKKESGKVYVNLNGYDENGAAKVNTAAELGASYMTAMEIFNIDADTAVTYIYRPFIVDAEGNTVYGMTYVVTFEAVS